MKKVVLLILGCVISAALTLSVMTIYVSFTDNRSPFEDGIEASEVSHVLVYDLSGVNIVRVLSKEEIVEFVSHLNEVPTYGKGSKDHPNIMSGSTAACYILTNSDLESFHLEIQPDHIYIDGLYYDIGESDALAELEKYYYECQNNDSSAENQYAT